MTLYHGTDRDNVFNIMREGLKPGPDGYVYFCLRQEDCISYLAMYRPAGKYQIAVIPIDFSDAEINAMEVNLDNAPMYTPMAYAHEGAIDKTRIPSLDKIKLYTIERR